MFIASPGDCDAERQLVRRVAQAVTQAVGSPLKVRIRVDGWETVAPDLGRPQAQINPLVDDCDVFVGLLGHKWGSPTGTHTSGFIEEFERAVERRGSGDVPQIAMFFRTPPAAMAADPGDELKKVLAFQQTLREDHVLLYRTFADINDLERQLWPLFAAQLVAVGTDGSISAGPAGTSAGADPSPVIRPETLDSEDIDDARRQLAATTDAVTRLALGDDDGPPIDADRLVLIAHGLSDQAGVIQSHIVNRLYLRRRELALSLLEADIWRRTMLSDIGRSPNGTGQVIPGWAVVGMSVERLSQELDQTEDEITLGVFRTLQRLGLRPARLWDADEGDESARVSVWSELLRRPSVIGAAASYWATVGGPADLPLIDAVLLEVEVADIAELRALWSGDPAPLAKTVATTYYAPEWKVRLIREALDSADGEVLQTLALGTNTPATLRMEAIERFVSQESLEDDTLAELLALRPVIDRVSDWVMDPSFPLSSEQLGRVVKGLGDSAPYGWELKARVNALTADRQMLLAALNGPSTAVGAWDALEWCEVGDGQELIERAREIFDTDAEGIVTPLLDIPEWHEHLDLMPFLRERARVGALRILMRQTEVLDEDLERVIVEMGRDDRQLAIEPVVWLAEHARPEDVSLLIANLPSPYRDEQVTVVQGILRAGGAPGARILLDSGVVPHADLVVRALAADDSVANEELRTLLYSTDERVRLTAVDELAKRYDDAELEALLDAYPRDADSYFYNVVTELDWRLFARTRATNDEDGRH